MHRQPPLEYAQSDRGNFSDGKMDTKKIVYYPDFSVSLLGGPTT